jgi:hypothetical protein
MEPSDRSKVELWLRSLERAAQARALSNLPEEPTARCVALNEHLKALEYLCEDECLQQPRFARLPYMWLAYERQHNVTGNCLFAWAPAEFVPPHCHWPGRLWPAICVCTGTPTPDCPCLFGPDPPTSRGLSFGVLPSHSQRRHRRERRLSPSISVAGYPLGETVPVGRAPAGLSGWAQCTSGDGWNPTRPLRASSMVQALAGGGR